MDNAILLNGVKVDILAAACFQVGDERTGCTDPLQPWRFDPMFSANGFRVDSHNAHSQPDGAYHYHGVPNALFSFDCRGSLDSVGRTMLPVAAAEYVYLSVSAYCILYTRHCCQIILLTAKRALRIHKRMPSIK